MSRPARETLQMRDFPGLMADPDPLDLDAGAARRQTNLLCWTGELVVRPGLRQASFEESVDVST